MFMTEQKICHMTHPGRKNVNEEWNGEIFLQSKKWLVKCDTYFVFLGSLVVVSDLGASIEALIVVSSPTISIFVITERSLVWVMQSVVGQDLPIKSWKRKQENKTLKIHNFFTF